MAFQPSCDPSPLDKSAQCLTRAVWEGSPRSGSGPPPCAKNKAGRCCVPVALATFKTDDIDLDCYSAGFGLLDDYRVPPAGAQIGSSTMQQQRTSVAIWIGQSIMSALQVVGCRKKIEERYRGVANEVVILAGKIVGCTCCLQEREGCTYQISGATKETCCYLV